MLDSKARRGFFRFLIAASAILPLSVFSSRRAASDDIKSTNARKDSTSILNPWTWQNEHGFVQGRKVGAGTTIYCSGQTSVDEAGNPMHKGDMAKQIELALDNLEKVLAEGGASLGNVVRTTYYVADMNAYFAASKVLISRYKARDCRATSTLIEVKSLFHPDILFEIEAIAHI